MKRFLTVLLVLMLLLTLCSPALAWSKKALKLDDFTVKLAKGSVNVLTENFDAIVKQSGKKISKINASADIDFEYALKAPQATFYTNDKDAAFADAIDFTSKGKTARGIKIGSKESDLLAAYPEPAGVESYGKYTQYVFQATSPDEGLTKSDIAHLDDVRPLYFYSIMIEVNDKTHKVTNIYFARSW